MARKRLQPGRCSMLARLLSPAMITSGRACTTHSGLTCGNGPMDAGRMLATPMRLSVSPMKDDSLAP